MSRVYANSDELRDFSQLLYDKQIQLDAICDAINNAINTARNEWQDAKAEEFNQAYQSRGKKTIDDLKQVMAEHKKELDVKIGFLDQYQGTRL